MAEGSIQAFGIIPVQYSPVALVRNCIKVLTVLVIRDTFIYNYVHEQKELRTSNCLLGSRQMWKRLRDQYSCEKVIQNIIILLSVNYVWLLHGMYKAYKDGHADGIKHH